jgi:hypothetical protein
MIQKQDKKISDGNCKHHDIGGKKIFLLILAVKFRELTSAESSVSWIKS